MGTIAHWQEHAVATTSKAALHGTTLVSGLTDGDMGVLRVSSARVHQSARARGL